MTELAMRAVESLWPLTSAAQARPMRLLGGPAVVVYRVDRVEDTRRRRSGGRAVVCPDALELMLSLPLGAPVPLDGLSSREGAALRTVPRWAVQVVDGRAVRRAVPPLSVELAVVEARSWRHGLERAGRFAPFSTRVMVLPRLPRDVDRMCMEADFWGVGVAVSCGEAVEVSVPPTVWRRRRVTAAGWRFQEQVYAQHRRARGRPVNAERKEPRHV